MYTVEQLNSEIAKKTETEVNVDFMKIKDNDTDNYCIMPKKFVDTCLDRIKNFEVFEDDTWIVTYPKCGTTWTQEMVWMILNNLNYEQAMKEDLYKRSPFLEWAGIINNFDMDFVDICQKLSRPRLIKSHLPLFLLPDQLWTVKPKIIYVARNPKDVAVSFYHHHCHLHAYKGTKEDFFEAFAKDLTLYYPFNSHVLEFWKIRNNSNILFLFYEDMKKDLENEVKKTMEFLGKKYSQDEIEKLCKHLSFDSMKQNKMINKNDEIRMLKEAAGEKYSEEEFSFIRKGQVGAYKSEMSAEQNQMLDDYCNDPKFKEFDFAYKF
ncbi:hypothetical protein PVAND_007737 [Polypedilum vanderplanki]|uniref:Sulfotransferase domain-containing protein n=1 Tax=Polypedilum vanderplanki TaxID=319348 RepID=A0A9J6C8Q3_POLVA|nr:hypothetical protein PVAND_007737 [Polypedilum vanderplanki]